MEVLRRSLCVTLGQQRRARLLPDLGTAEGRPISEGASGWTPALSAGVGGAWTEPSTRLLEPELVHSCWSAGWILSRGMSSPGHLEAIADPTSEVRHISGGQVHQTWTLSVQTPSVGGAQKVESTHRAWSAFSRRPQWWRDRSCRREASDRDKGKRATVRLQCGASGALVAGR